MSTMRCGCGGFRIWRPRTGQAVAAPEHVDAYIWVVTRHEIDYRGNIAARRKRDGRTWIESSPARCATLTGGSILSMRPGKFIVRANTTWAMIDRASGRLMRVPAEVAAPFLASA
jgi:acyl-CoA thioester hydrolase